MFISIHTQFQFSLRTRSKPYLGQEGISNNKVGLPGADALCTMTWNLADSRLLAIKVLRQNSSYYANVM